MFLNRDGRILLVRWLRVFNPICRDLGHCLTAGSFQIGLMRLIHLVKNLWSVSKTDSNVAAAVDIYCTSNVG
jgi:hypothetical protein